jgi:hypothetical protein
MQIEEINTKEKTTKKLIQKSLSKAISYADYRLMVEELAHDGKSTSLKQTEALSNYTILNDRRMKRFDKTIKIELEAQLKIKAFERKITWLVITESWCGDAAPALPAINKLTELNQNIDLKIVLRDENLDLMRRFSTHGKLSIPKLITIYKETSEVLGVWGPRSSTATKMAENYKEKHGKLSPEFKEELQLWYNKDKGRNIIENVLAGLPLKQVGNCPFL